MKTAASIKVDAQDRYMFLSRLTSMTVNRLDYTVAPGNRPFTYEVTLRMTVRNGRSDPRAISHEHPTGEDYTENDLHTAMTMVQP